MTNHPNIADISAFESLQNQAHENMGILPSRMAVFNAKTTWADNGKLYGKVYTARAGGLRVGSVTESLAKDDSMLFMAVSDNGNRKRFALLSSAKEWIESQIVDES